VGDLDALTRAGEKCRVITDDAKLTQARLWLCEGCRVGLANALGLLGVSAPGLSCAA